MKLKKEHYSYIMMLGHLCADLSFFALSAATVAFAATESVFTCPACGATVKGEKEFNTHLEKTCPVVGSEGKYKDCPYEGCTAKFKSQTEYDKHLEICFYKPEPTIADKVSDFIAGIDFKEVVGKVADVLGGIDFAGILSKVIGFLGDAVGKISF